MNFVYRKPEDLQADEPARVQKPPPDTAVPAATGTGAAGGPIGCEEALHLWEEAQAGGHIGDPARLGAALLHLRQCQERCVEVLTPDQLRAVEQMARDSAWGDVYEALGLSYEEAGDAHHRRYKRLRKSGRASEEELERERGLALENWKTATQNYEAGARFFKSLFLTDALKRMQRKLRLLPNRPGAAGAAESAKS